MIALAVGVVVLLTLSACAAAPTPRTQPNTVELAALARAGNEFSASTGRSAWVQLWTRQQAGPAIQDCVHRVSNGLLEVDVQVGPNGIGYGYSSSFEGTNGSDIDQRGEPFAVQRVVDRCIAETPIDDRVTRLPRRDWGVLYSYDVTVLRKCLIAHGESVARAPDRDRFESLLDGGMPWSPYDRVIVPDRAAWYALSDACPVIPPGYAVD
jgi:hypothetical protein